MVQFNPTGARQAGYNYVDNVLDEADRRKAGGLYASGDVTGAQRELARSGNIDGAMTMQREQARISEAARVRAEAERDDDNTWLVQGMTGLRGLPMEQRQTVYQSQIRPLLARQLDEAELSRIDAADFSDAELDAGIRALGGSVASPYANDRAGRGGDVVRPDPYTGVYSRVYEAPVDPLDAVYRQAQIDALRASETQRLAGARKADRGPAPRGGGGSRSRGGGSAPSAPARAGKMPWER